MAALASALPGGGSPQLDSMLNGSASSLDSIMAKQSDRDDKAYAKTEDIVSKVEKERYDFDTNFKPPTPKPLPDPPKTHMREPLEAFGSLASTLAIFGSLMTRHSLTNSLNAAAGVMNAYRAQDIEQAKFEFENWKANLDNFKAQHQFEMDAYDAALKKLDSDSHAALSEVQAIAAATKNENMMMLAQQRNYEGIFKLVEQSKMNAGKIDEIEAKIHEMNDKALSTVESNKLWQTFLKENPNASNDDKIAKYKEIYHPAAAAAQERADAATGAHGNLTPKQDADMARQAFDTIYPKNISGRRPGKVGPDGNVIAVPEYQKWLSDEWPKLREKFTAQHGAKPPDAAHTPTETPNPVKADAAPDLPKEIVSQLKEGYKTTLSDGTVWTLKDGKPVQLQVK